MSETLTKPLADLYKQAKRRPAGYVEDVLFWAIVDKAAGAYTLTQNAWDALVAKYRRPWCRNCEGPHWSKDCPIPPDYEPSKEVARMRHGGCCGHGRD